MNIADFKNRFRTHSVATDTALNDSGALADVVGWDSGGYGYHYCYGIPITISNKIKKFNLTITLELYKGYSKTYSRELCAWISTTKYETTKSNIQFDLLMNELKLAKENDEYNSKRIKFELGVSEKGIPKTLTQTINRELEPGQYYIYIYDEGIFGVSVAKTSLHYLRNLVFDIGQKISYYLTGFKEGNRLIKEEIDEDIFTKDFVNYSSYLSNYSVRGFKEASSIFLINKNGGRQEYLSDTEFAVTSFILDSTVELYYNPIEYNINYNYIVNGLENCIDTNLAQIPNDLKNNNPTTYTIIQGPTFSNINFTGYTCNEWQYNNNEVTGINEVYLDSIEEEILNNRKAENLTITGIFNPNTYTYTIQPISDTNGEILQSSENQMVLEGIYNTTKISFNSLPKIQYYNIKDNTKNIEWTIANNNIVSIEYVPNLYKITYYGDLKNDIIISTYTVESSIPFDLYIPTNENGYKFIGWSDSISTSENKAHIFSSMNDINIKTYTEFNFNIENIALYGVWVLEEVPYRIKHYIQDNFDEVNPTYSLHLNQLFIGRANEQIPNALLELEGFEGKWNFENLYPNIDGSTVIECYYNRLSYTCYLKEENEEKEYHYLYEQPVTFMYNKEGYEYIFTVNGNEKFIGTSYSFIMPAYPLTIEVKEKLAEYILSVDLNGGTLTNSIPERYTINDTIEFGPPTADNADGFTVEFLYWTLNGEKISQKTITINPGSIGDRYYVAYYKYTYGNNELIGSSKVIRVKDKNKWQDPFTI